MDHGHAYLNMMAECDAVKSSVQLFRESLRFQCCLTSTMLGVNNHRKRLFTFNQEQAQAAAEEGEGQQQQDHLETQLHPN
eukprot:3732051-Rhodomonas_salina.1